MELECVCWSVCELLSVSVCVGVVDAFIIFKVNSSKNIF